MNLWQLLQKLRPFVRPYRLLVIVTLILTLIGSLTAQVNALTLKYAVDSMNPLLQQGHGLAQGWHILITITLVLLTITNFNLTRFISRDYRKIHYVSTDFF